MDKESLIQFEKDVIEAFESGIIHAPIHLSGGNEQQLIDIFKGIARTDWVFSTHRSHYHALLHGIPCEELMRQILDGHSMNLNFPAHQFYTSAIVGGIIPMALGVAAGIKMNGGKERAWCFIGDMAATTGAFHDAYTFAIGHDLPITFVIEDNGLSTDTPTKETWGKHAPIINTGLKIWRYHYRRQYPHCNTGRMVQFV